MFLQFYCQQAELLIKVRPFNNLFMETMAVENFYLKTASEFRVT